jgi:hypothetical protein
MYKFEEYRRFAAACLEMARTMRSPTTQERASLIEMALLWSRLAERAASRRKRAPLMSKGLLR